MVARFSAAGLGLIAFAIAVISGLIAENPVTVTLIRSILALFLFCLIGLSLGKLAEIVILERQQGKEREILERFTEAPPQGNLNSRGPTPIGES